MVPARSLFNAFSLGVVLLGAAAPLTASFSDVSASAQIDYVHAELVGATTDFNVAAAAGAAAVDVDGDGWTDLVAARGFSSCVLYMNRHDGTFSEESAARGLAGTMGIGGIGAGDFDNDGDADMFMVPAEGPRCFLYINDGTGHFAEQAVSRGADLSTTVADHHGYSVAVVDYDRDGYLDIHFGEWQTPSTSEDTLHSALLHNRGAAAPGSFENRTAEAGLTQPRSGQTHFGFSTGWADFDGDGWPDLSLIQDFGRSLLYWNNGNGTFTEATASANVGVDENGMGLAIADYDGDGRLDFLATSIFDTISYQRTGVMTGNKLYRYLGGRAFGEVAETAGVARTGWSWGGAFFDYENDGDADLVVTNGSDFARGGDPRITPFTSAVNDPTALFLNGGAGVFSNATAGSGITDTDLGRAVVVWDYDNDGDEDLLITQAYGRAILYRNSAAMLANRWMRFRFVGTHSNRDGMGALVRVTTGGHTFTKPHAPTNAYIGQREPVLHFGLGAAGATVDQVEVTWPSGIMQTVAGLATNQVHTLTEPGQALVAPAVTHGLQASAVRKGGEVVFSVTATGHPAPVFVWQKDGVVIPGMSGPQLRLTHIHPFDAGLYTVTAVNQVGAASASARLDVSIDVAAHSVARWWDEFLLDGIRKDRPNPPVHARNLYHLSAAMWDAFWPYELEGWSQALPVFHRETVTSSDWAGGREAAQRTAISHAAYRVLAERFRNSPGKARTLYGFRWLMQQLGCDPDDTGTTGSSPAAIGNRIGYAVLAACADDGANDGANYADLTGYTAVNEPLVVALPGTTMADPNRWQPLALKHAVTQNGIVEGAAVQAFVGVNGLVTTPFALLKTSPTVLAIDPGPPPRLGTATEDAFVEQAVEVILLSSMLDPRDGALMDISPGVQLNNPLGTNDGRGRALNPISGQPYAANVVKRADFARVLAEFWADGPDSETPPGHWNVLHNEVTDDPRFVRRYAGAGPELSPLEWDVRAYLALNGAVHDAACAAWGLKRIYDSGRPISMIRYLGGLGQSSDPFDPSYHPQGLPLVPGLIEIITPASAVAGQRHAHLVDSIGRVAIRAWLGDPVDRSTEVGGVGWILASRWLPYQMETFVTPAFPAFVSGHSTFSRAAAEVMTLMTGSPYFPGGIAEFRAPAGRLLRFEYSPSSDVTLQWATYYDAADQAGRSRLWGGIHIAADDFAGRRIGSRVGLDAFLKAQHLRSGGGPERGLANISTRGRSGSGEEVMIAGFVIDGDTPQPTLMRAVGPELARLGVAEPETDPRLTLRRAGSDVPLVTNDDWGSGPRATQVAARAAEVGAFSLTAGGRDAADLVTLDPGIYTVVEQSPQAASRGVALTEIYGHRLVNVSTRGSVGTGEGVLIAGFVIDGTDPSPVLIRGVGPALAAHGVSGVLGDPVLSVRRQLPEGGSELVATNDNWSLDDRASLIAGAAAVSGAFALQPGSHDAALLLQLPAGTYTAIVSGAGQAQGVALVEVYHVK